MNMKIASVAVLCALSVGAWAKTLSVAEREAARKNRLGETQKPAAVSTTTAPGATATVPEELRKLTGDTLLNAAGEKKGTEVLAGKKVVLFYFSASWCGPCRAFTPSLVKAYEQWKKDNVPVEVILVGADRDEKSMLEYMKSHKMEWYALPHGSKEAQAINEANGVRGIPTLIVYNSEGKVITPNGRGEIMQKGADAAKDWLK